VIPRNRFFNIYLHHFLQSDDDRALHDHPWWSLGMILSKQGYIEVLPHPKWPITMRHIYRRRFRPVLRRPTHAHRIQLIGHYNNTPKPVWTLFITGPRLREWGFLCPKRWVHWSHFTDENGKRAGRGCE